MNELNEVELELISGGVGVCRPGTNIAGVTSSGGIDIDVSLYYDALVAAASRAIERVANSL